MTEQAFKRAIRQSSLTNEAQEAVLRGMAFAQRAHAGQKRKSGEEYIVHPRAVAATLLEWGLDADTVIAGLLHDTVEDTVVSESEVANEFGATVGRLVDGVTKIGHVRLNPSMTSDERSTENLRKLLLAMSQDIRVILIKLADRLHNLRTLEHLPPDKQQRIARESLSVYAPLADRLGMGELKAEIEDISFSYLDPKSYATVEQLRDQRLREAERDYAELIAFLRKQIKAAGITATIATRVKHLYSVHKKLKNKANEIGSIYDIMAARVIVDEVKQCYEVLGIVHERYKPLIYRIKDFIAVPKPNGYQSLHTTVLSPSGSIFEVQIRTQQMHDEAERGLAAHFYYDAQKASKAYRDRQSVALPKKLEWVSGLLEWQDSDGTASFREDLFDDLFSDRIFVFSPLGDLYDLPDGATPVDFAFAVHGQLGYRMRGAKVNGRIVNLNHKLSNRDIVEIVASKKDSGPSRDWLNFVVTSKAKNRIRAWFRTQDRSANQAMGKELVEDELSRLHLPKLETLPPDRLAALCKQFNRSSVEELYVAIGEGQISVGSLIQRVATSSKKRPKLQFLRKIASAQKATKVEVAGDRSISYELAPCCQPKPGSQIVARTHRGVGILIHRQNCRQISRDTSSLLPAQWYQPSSLQHHRLLIKARDRVNLLGDITSLIARHGAAIVGIHSHVRPGQTDVQIEVRVEVKDVLQLNTIMKELEKITGIATVVKR